MPKLFDHVGEHHPDQNFIFDQEYGCLAEHLRTALGRAHRDHPGNIVLTIIIVPSRFEFWKLRFSTFLPGSTSASARRFPDLAPPAQGLFSSLALASLSEGSVGFE
jgi:hypothetical protein